MHYRTYESRIFLRNDINIEYIYIVYDTEYVSNVIKFNHYVITFRSFDFFSFSLFLIVPFRRMRYLNTFFTLVVVVADANSFCPIKHERFSIFISSYTGQVF